MGRGIIAHHSSLITCTETEGSISRKELMTSEALGLLETKGLVALIEGSDAMLKAANVEMIGWDKCGSGMVTSFVKGDVAAVKAAIDAGAEAAGRGGSVGAVDVLAR